MQSTSTRLLEKLRSLETEPGWNRFVDLYGPMIYNWGRHHGLTRNAAYLAKSRVLTRLRQQLDRLPDLD